MFVLAKDPQFSWPVTVRVPVDDGLHEVQRFTARFRLLPRQVMAKHTGDPVGLLKEALVAWSEVVDEGNRPVPYSADAADAMLAIPYVLTGLAEAYAEALSGAAARKN
jgi:hypothetical protein